MRAQRWLHVIPPDFKQMDVRTKSGKWKIRKWVKEKRRMKH